MDRIGAKMWEVFLESFLKSKWHYGYVSIVLIDWNGSHGLVPIGLDSVNCLHGFLCPGHFLLEVLYGASLEDHQEENWYKTQWNWL